MTDFEGLSHFPLSLDAVPKGWSVTSLLGAGCEVESGFASGKHNSTGDGVTHLRPMNIDRGGRIDLSVVKSVAVDKSHKRINSGEVLFNNTNSPALVGKTAYVDLAGDWAFSNHMTRISPGASVEPRFLAYQLHYFWSAGYFGHICTNHVNQASVSSKRLGVTVPIVVPPLPEQHRIVAAIEEHFSHLDAADSLINSVRHRLELLTKSPPVLPVAACSDATKERERILSGRRKQFEIAEDQKAAAHKKARRGNYSEPLPPPEDLPDPPPGMVWMSLDELCHFIVDYRGKTPPGAEQGVPVISAANVRDGVVSIDATRCVSEETYQAWLSRGVPVEGDLVITTEAPVAEAAIYPGGGPYLPTRRVIVLKTGLKDNRYLVKALKQPSTHQYLQRHTRGTTVPRILKPALLRTPIAVPDNRTQAALVELVEARAEVVERVDERCTASQARSRSLRRSILAAAFSGKLVPQDPSDEPASVLLERIAAERAAAKPARKKAAKKRKKKTAS